MAGKGNDSAPVNSEATWIVGIVVIGATLVAIWHLQRQLIVLPLFAMKWLQVKGYELVMGLPERGYAYLHFIEDYFTGRKDPKGIYWGEFVDVAETVGRVMEYTMPALIMGLAILVSDTMSHLSGGVIHMSGRVRHPSDRVSGRSAGVRHSPATLFDVPAACRQGAGRVQAECRHVTRAT